MKHIVHVSNDYEPLTGGINTHLICLLNELGRLNYRITLLVPGSVSHYRGDFNAKNEEGAKYTIVRSAYPGTSNPASSLIHLTQSTKAALEWIENRYGAIDLIHQHDHRATRLGASLYAAKHGIPLLWTNHASDYFGQKNRYIRWISTFSGIRPDGLIAVHRSVAEQFQKSAFRGLPVRYIPNGVDTEFFSPASPVPGKDEITILFPQRMVQIKGPVLLAEAAVRIFNNHPDFKGRFLFAGSEAASNRAMETIRKVQQILEPLKNKGKIKFLGNPAYREMAGLYRSADIVVLPLQQETENLSVFEAWASGTSLITTMQVEKNGYMVHRKNCLIVPDCNIEKLAAAILTLAENSQLRNKLAANGRQTAEERFTWKKAAIETADFYEYMTGRIK